MSHPKNRRERFLIGCRKGKKRAFGYWGGVTFLGSQEPEEFYEKQAQLRRDTTKLCSCSMCGNPRNKCKDKLTMQEKKFNEFYLRRDEP